MKEETGLKPSFSPKIMVIDDNPTNVLLLKRILNAHGYRDICTITDSCTAIDQFKIFRPDIILLDLLMPNIDGIELLRQLAEIKSKEYLPVIMITADNSMENRIKALKIGANDYISKPFDAEELIARIENLILLKSSMDRTISTETAFLQAQIKPHFLYNTLNTISSFCETDPEKASKLIDDFSVYLRQSFDFKTTENFVPVEREIQLVESFVAIQKARFGSRVSFFLQTLDEMNFYVPPLCIQPLVENSIRHGLKCKENVEVTVRFEKAPLGVAITVKDNANGIPQENMNSILTRSEKNGIGLCNIDSRLKHFFTCGLHIKSTWGIGTEISYYIPTEVTNETSNYRG